MARIGTKVNVELLNSDYVLPNVAFNITDFFWQDRFQELSTPLISSGHTDEPPGAATNNANNLGPIGAPAVSNRIFHTDGITKFAGTSIILKPQVLWADTIIDGMPKNNISKYARRADHNFRFESQGGNAVNGNKLKGNLQGNPLADPVPVAGKDIQFLNYTLGQVSNAIVDRQRQWVWKSDFSSSCKLHLKDYKFENELHEDKGAGVIEPFQGVAFRFFIRRSPEPLDKHDRNTATDKNANKNQLNARQAPYFNIKFRNWGLEFNVHGGDQIKASILQDDAKYGLVEMDSVPLSINALNRDGDKIWCSLVVYPFYDFLYVSFSTDIELNEQISWGKAIQLRKDKRTAPTTASKADLEVNMNGNHHCGFQMGFVKHVKSAFLISSPVITPYERDLELERAMLKINYIGKNNSRYQGSGSGGFRTIRKLIQIWGKQTSNDVQSYDYDFMYGPIRENTEIHKLMLEKDNAQSFAELEKAISVSGITDQDVIKRIREMANTWEKDIQQQQYKFIILMKTNKAIYTPGVISAEFNALPALVNVSIDDEPIKDEDILSVNINQNVRGITAEVELLNRHREKTEKGRYTFHNGIKPIKMDLFDDSGDPEGISHFRGYVTQRAPGLTDMAHYGAVTWSCEDVSIRLKSTRTFNLPIFDGWCALAAMFYLVKVAGFSTSFFSIFSNPNDIDDFISIEKIMTDIGNDNLSMTGPCWEGHVRGFPKDQDVHGVKVPGRVLHYVLANGIGLGSSPFYMTQMGRDVWDIMDEIATKDLGWFLYANNRGDIVLQPPNVAFGISIGDKVSKTELESEKSKPKFDYEFVEVSKGPERYSELKRAFSGSYDPRQNRNAVIMMGLIPMGNNPATADAIPMPYAAIQKDQGWPNNTTSHSWRPWLDVFFQANPELGVKQRIDQLAQLYAKRLFKRPFFTARWSAWGQKTLHPYMIISVDEHFTREVQQENKVKYIVTSIRHSFGKNNLLYESEIEGEIFLDTYEWILPIEQQLPGTITEPKFIKTGG